MYEIILHEMILLHIFIFVLIFRNDFLKIILEYINILYIGVYK